MRVELINEIMLTETADRIPAISLTPFTSNGTIEETNLKWEEPISPNGMVLSYQIEYRRVDSDKVRELTDSQYKS